jgi:hypothetical protein
MKISEAAVKLMKQYAARPAYGYGLDPSPAVVYHNGVEDGVTILAEQILEQIKDEEQK